MRAWLLIFLALPLAASAEDYTIDMTKGNEAIQLLTTTTGDVWIRGGVGVLALTLADNGEAVVVNPQVCSSKSASTCDEYLWDHDGNGTKTQSELNGDGATLTRGTELPPVSFYRVTVTTPPGTSNVAELVVVRRVSK